MYRWVSPGVSDLISFPLIEFLFHFLNHFLDTLAKHLAKYWAIYSVFGLVEAFQIYLHYRERMKFKEALERQSDEFRNLLKETKDEILQIVDKRSEEFLNLLKGKTDNVDLSEEVGKFLSRLKGENR